MRTFLIGVPLFLFMMTMGAYWLVPRGLDDGRTPLIWTTDPNPQRQPQVALFNEMYPHLKLNIDPDNADVMKVVVQSSAGMGPDIIGRIGAHNIQTYHEAGILMDLTDYADDMGFGLDTLSDSVRSLVTLPVLMDDGTIQDRMFAYPCNATEQFIMYNKNVFDRAGVPYPPEDLTWERYLEIAEKLTVVDPAHGIPEVFGAAGASVEALLFAHGAEFINEHGTRCTMDSPEFIDAMVFYHRLFYELGAEPTPLQRVGVTSQGGWGGGYNNWFGEGKIGMYWGARWMLISFRRFISEQERTREAWLANHPDADPAGAPEVLRLGACQIPRFENGVRHSLSAARMAGINAASPHRKQALYFMQYLAGEPYSRLINEGSDSNPGNVKYHALDQFINPDWPGEEAVHAAALRAVPYGRAMRQSMLIDAAIVESIFSQVRSNIQASPELTRERLATELERGAERVDVIIARNIKRNPKVRLKYEALLAKGAEPIVYDLDEVR